MLDRLADGGHDEKLDVIDERVGVDLKAAADALPEKTGVQLNTRTLVGTIDAPGSGAGRGMRSDEQWR